jgi:hypothetical protein
MSAAEMADTSEAAVYHINLLNALQVNFFAIPFNPFSSHSIMYMMTNIGGIE